MEPFPIDNRLHTDVLEEQYGPISARVLRHDSTIREAHLVDAEGISRTYALTFLKKPANEEVASIDAQIKAGGAIGKTFREHGYIIRKNVIDVFVLALPQWLQDNFHDITGYAKTRVSEFYAKKEASMPVHYGDVFEVYSPDFRMPIVNVHDLKQINPITSELIQIGVSRMDLWGRLGAQNEWMDMEKDYVMAKIACFPIVFALREQLNHYIQNK